MSIKTLSLTGATLFVLGGQTSKVFQIVLEIQQHITKIPGQVQFQQPVSLIDTFGKTSPFHLEFIRSAKVWIFNMH